VVELVIRRGGKVDYCDRLNMTPLMCAAQQGSVECVRLILEKLKADAGAGGGGGGVDKSLKRSRQARGGGEGALPLSLSAAPAFAAAGGSKDSRPGSPPADELNRIPGLNARDKSSFSALAWAMWEGSCYERRALQIKCAELLLAAGAHPMVHDWKSKNILHYAAEYNYRYVWRGRARGEGKCEVCAMFFPFTFLSLAFAVPLFSSRLSTLRCTRFQ
jgi:hypothetical protein